MKNSVYRAVVSPDKSGMSCRRGLRPCNGNPEVIKAGDHFINSARSSVLPLSIVRYKLTASAGSGVAGPAPASPINRPNAAIAFAAILPLPSPAMLATSNRLASRASLGAMAHFDFSGRTALITGAASGIGAACATWLAGNGCAEIVLVDIDEAGLDALDLPCPSRRFIGDVADETLWDEVEGSVGRLDHAVLSARP